MAQYKVMTQGFYIVPITVASLAVIEQYFTFHIARIAHKGNYIKCHTLCTEQINILNRYARAPGLFERDKMLF